METIAHSTEETLSSASVLSSETGGLNATTLSQTTCNLVIAIVFFVALWAHASGYHSLGDVLEHTRSCAGLADLVWMAGAALMGLLSLIRVPPIAATVNFRSVLATGAMMVAPALIKPHAGVSGFFVSAGLALECFGVIASEGSRIYLGRRFSFLPANRGIVAAGPFSIVRHPIYSGWFLLTLGLVMACPTLRNALMLALTVPVMILRIDLEERLLAQDPEYCTYRTKTRYRLIPYVY